MAAQLAYQGVDDDNSKAPKEINKRYSSLPLFDEALGNKFAITTKQADAWADAIVCYWQSVITTGAMAADNDCYLLDLAPRDNQTAWLLLNALTQCLTAQGLSLRWCYLACYDDAASAADHAGHPYFREWIAAGRIDFVYWDATHMALHLSQQDIILSRSENPLVIIANGYLQKQASELFCLHKGQLMQGTVATTIEIDPANNNVHHFKYQWQESDATSPCMSESVVAHYRHHCNGAALQFPQTGSAILDQVNDFAQGHTLLLAADPGVCSDSQIRLGALCPPARWQAGDAAPPVNFHGLSLYQREQGARVWQQQLDDTGLVVHMAVSDDTNTLTQENFQAIAATLVDAHPDEMRQLASTQHSAADTLMLLRLSHYDPKLLKSNIANFIEQPLELSGSARRNWQQALVNTWYNFLPGKAYDGFYYHVGLMAAQLGHYGLAKECFRFGLAWYGDATSDLYLLAWCEAVSGGVETAVELLARALALEPEHGPSQELSMALQAQLARWQQNHWYLPPTAREQDNTTTGADTPLLLLEPLGPEHAEALLYQYRDRQIGIMTCLPALDTLAQTREWIAKEQQDDDRASFAVMHPCWGLVGMVSIHCSGDAGYFYFWIGSDFQGHGLGQQAAQLLFALMAQHGVTEIFTSGYEDNLRSIHALTRLGFEELAVRALAPDDALKFFHLSRGDEQSHDTAIRHANSRAALSALCCAIKSPLSF